MRILALEPYYGGSHRQFLDAWSSHSRHEFFGISAAEPAAAGAMPILPERLSYPEIFQLGKVQGAEALFYSGGAAGLADRLTALAGTPAWPEVAAAMDDAIEALRTDR